MAAEISALRCRKAAGRPIISARSRALSRRSLSRCAPLGCEAISTIQCSTSSSERYRSPWPDRLSRSARSWELSHNPTGRAVSPGRGPGPDRGMIRRPGSFSSRSRL